MGNKELRIMPVAKAIDFEQHTNIARRVVRGMVDGLQYLHSQGIIHRDVRPSNLITHGMDVVIVDFETSYLPHMPSLLCNITNNDKRLISLTTEEAEEMLSRHPSIVKLLKNAWHAESFKELRHLGAFLFIVCLFVQTLMLLLDILRPYCLPLVKLIPSESRQRRCWMFPFKHPLSVSCRHELAFLCFLYHSR